MKKSILLSIGALLFSVNIYAQTYDFINEIVEYASQDTIHLFEKHMFFDKTNIDVKFSTDNLKYLWTPIPHHNVPDIELFLNNFDLIHLREGFKNKNDFLIDFSKLDEKFVKITDEDLVNIKKQLNNKLVKKRYKEYLNKGYLQISKPVFNCSKDWAVVIIESINPYLNIYSGGYLNIYRKVDNKWLLYHKFELWVS